MACQHTEFATQSAQLATGADGSIAELPQETLPLQPKAPQPDLSQTTPPQPTKQLIKQPIKQPTKQQIIQPDVPKARQVMQRDADAETVADLTARHESQLMQPLASVQHASVVESAIVQSLQAMWQAANHQEQVFFLRWLDQELELNP